MEKHVEVYLPNNKFYKDPLWYENILGRIIKPAIEFEKPKWVFLLRYSNSLASLEGIKLKKKYEFVIEGVPFSPLFRSFKLRYEENEKFENNLKKILESEKCWYKEISNYDIISDLGGVRFINTNTDKERSGRMLRNIKEFVNLNTLMTLEYIIEDKKKGFFKFEPSEDKQQNPFSNTSMFSLNHLFCNTGDLFLFAYMYYFPRSGSLIPIAPYGPFPDEKVGRCVDMHRIVF